MDEPTKKAFDFAADVTKQLITVASAIVTLTVTFAKDTPAPARGWAYAAWFSFILSIMLGFGALMSMTGELQPQPKANAPAAGNPNPSVWKGNITGLSISQIAVFLIAIGLTAWFGSVAMQFSANTQAQAQPPQVCNCVFPTPQTNPQSAPVQTAPKPKTPHRSASPHPHN